MPQDDCEDFDIDETITKPDEKMKEKSVINRVSLYGMTHKKSTESQWTETNMGWVHESEMESFIKGHPKCIVTGKYYPSHQGGKTADLKFVSNEALRKPDCEWVLCCHSGSIIPKTLSFEVYDDAGNAYFITKRFKEDNYVKCVFTGKFYKVGHMLAPGKNHTGISPLSLHATRTTDKFVTCRDCGGVWLVTMGIVSRRDEFDNVNLCAACFERRQARNSILEHSATSYPPAIICDDVIEINGKPTKRKHNQVRRNGKMVMRKDLRLYGVEAEVECISGIGEDSRAKLAIGVKKSLGEDFVIIKHDGSLTNGFEIVTAPADIHAHRAYWPKITRFNGAEKLRAWDTDTCGMHVHVSKASLTTLQVGRILLFINHANNRKFVQKVAGRSAERWSKYVPKELRDSLTRDDDKYVAVNTKHDATIEFRIFRGTIHPRHIVRNIEFVDAVCQFCYSASRSFKDLMNTKDFIQFCADNRREYPLFNEWLVLHKHLPERKLGPGMSKPVVVEAEAIV